MCMFVSAHRARRFIAALPNVPTSPPRSPVGRCLGTPFCETMRLCGEFFFIIIISVHISVLNVPYIVIYNAVSQWNGLHLSLLNIKTQIPHALYNIMQCTNTHKTHTRSQTPDREKLLLIQAKALCHATRSTQKLCTYQQALTTALGLCWRYCVRRRFACTEMWNTATVVLVPANQIHSHDTRVQQQ